MWYCEAFVGAQGHGHPALVFLDQPPQPDPDMPVVVGVRTTRPWTLSFRAPKGPLPFCGHGTLVAAWVFAQIHGDGALTLSTPSRQVHAEVQGDTVRLQMPGATVRPAGDQARLAAALGLDAVEHAVRANAGSEKWLVRVSAEQLDTLQVDNDALRALSQEHSVNGAYVFAEVGSTVRARAFNPLANPREDRATGVAALALSAHLKRPLHIIQGPPGESALHLRAQPISEGLLLEGRVRGHSREVSL